VPDPQARLWRDHSQNRFPGIQLRGGCPAAPRDASRKQVTLDRAPVFEWTAELGKLGSAHETENKVRLGLPRIIQRKENAPEFDYSSFYGKTGTGKTNCFVMEVERSL
jgi:hypothetical protein